MKIGRILIVALPWVLAFGLRSGPLAAPHYSPWSAPLHLAAPVNSTFVEQSATLSNDLPELLHHVDTAMRCW
jgi:hypothetical protein